MSPMQVLVGVITLLGYAAAAHRHHVPGHQGHDGNIFDDAASVLDNAFG